MLFYFRILLFEEPKGPWFYDVWKFCKVPNGHEKGASRMPFDNQPLSEVFTFSFLPLHHIYRSTYHPVAWECAHVSICLTNAHDNAWLLPSYTVQERRYHV